MEMDEHKDSQRITFEASVGPQYQPPNIRFQAVFRPGSTCKEAAEDWVSAAGAVIDD